jgi:hypothetical protein
MIRWLTATLLLCVSFVALACPLCMGYRPSTAQQLATLEHAVLAIPVADGDDYRVVATIKGAPPPDGKIAAAAVHVDAAKIAGGKPLLLARGEVWPMWVSFGAMGSEHAGWLREIVVGKPSTEFNASEWRARVARMLPYLESPEPMVAEVAYGELATAPYAALQVAKPRLAATSVRRWLADAKLAARQPLYLLLLGITGDSSDAVYAERRLDAAWTAGDATNVGSLLAADLELRGPVRLSWVDERYLLDPKRTTPEVEAALLALSAHGDANGRIPRERVIASYRQFMQVHKDIAGYVARDFAEWQYWDAVPEYVTLMQSNIRQQYPSRLAIVAYLRQSPLAKTAAGDSQLAKELSSEPSATLVRSPGTPIVSPQ